MIKGEISFSGSEKVYCNCTKTQTKALRPHFVSPHECFARWMLNPSIDASSLSLE